MLVQCPPAPGPLEDYCVHFDEVFRTPAQRRGFREYLTGLLAPRDRNKTLTCLAGAEPVVGAQHAAVQRLQYFLSEAHWDDEAVNTLRLQLLLTHPATAPHPRGALVIDDSGDRKDGNKTAHVGRQYLGRVGKTDNGIVTVTTVWADERVYYPLHARPYTPASYFPKGGKDPGFNTKLRIAAELTDAAKTAGVVCRAVVADCIYGQDNGLRGWLREAGFGFVVALKPSHGRWQYGKDAYTPKDAAQAIEWHGPDKPGGWTKVERAFRDGHTETWWAADATLGFWGPDGDTRLVVATKDPHTLPDKATWYLASNLPRPGGPYDTPDAPHEPADLAEIVRLYGIRNWIEQSYKQVKTELGWADFQVRSDAAIRRHQTLVHCAFSFCWDTWFGDMSTNDSSDAQEPEPPADPGERGARTRPDDSETVLAQGFTQGPLLADPMDHPAADVDRLVGSAAAG